jgi:prepilin-type N-terminal cleavage/methylation domain-containing protein
MRSKQSQCSGFTLVELLMVISIIGLLTAIVLPAIASVKAEAHSTQCLSNLRQMYTAISSFRAANKDVLPIAAPLQGDAIDPDFVLLADRLSKIIPRESGVCFCPADHSEESQFIGSSYVYTPGAFMLAVLPECNSRAHAARIITNRYDSDYLRSVALLIDSEAYHDTGGRNPFNALFIDGQARVLRPGDNVVADPPADPQE